MPKGKMKGSGKGHPRRGGSSSRHTCLSDEESVNDGDACSTLSVCSDRGSIDDGENGNEGDNEDGSSVSSSREVIEEKISEAIDLMTEKAAGVRAEALKSLVRLLSQQCVPELFLNLRETLRDNLVKLMKRGQRSEQGLAADIFQLFMLQMGALDLDEVTIDFNEVKAALQCLSMDHTLLVEIRSKAINALCLGTFLVGNGGAADIMSVTTLLETLFTDGKNQGLRRSEVEVDGSKCGKIVKTKSVNSSLASTAISGWSLLLTQLPESYLQERCCYWIQDLYKLLDDPELELRLHAGEAVALLVELCDLYEECDSEEDGIVQKGVEHISEGSVDFATVDDHSMQIQIVISKLRSLSVESRKYRTKRDRRQQRHNFRDYLHAVERGEGPDLSIKFGCGEVLEIESWTKKRQYDAISQVLGSGINRQLADNALIRQILDLGPVSLHGNEGTANSKQAKNERHYLNSMNFKARCVARGKSRDIRRSNLSDD